MDIKEIRTIIKNNPDVLSTHEKARAFLADVFLNDQMRINVMMNAYDVGIIEAIKKPTSFTINQIISGIESRYGVSEVRAKEAVEIWISILSQDDHDIEYQIRKEGTVASEGATSTSSAHRPQSLNLHASNATVNSTQQNNSNSTQVASASVKQTQKVGQPNVLRQNPSSNMAQPVSNGVHPTLPQQPTTQKQTPTTVNTPPSLSAAAYTTNVQQVQQTVTQNNLPTNATIQNAQAKRSKSATIVTIISVVTGVGILLIVGLVGFSVSKLLKAKSEAIAQSEREESRAIAKSEREESIALAESERKESIAMSESEAAASRAASSETTNNSTATNSNTTKYIEQNFEGLSFEVPADSLIEYNRDNPDESFAQSMLIEFNSESSYIMIFSIDLSEKDIEIDASKEEEQVQTTRQKYLENQGATNINTFETNFDGMFVGGAYCQLNSMPTEMYVFLSKDYSKIYIVLFQVYNSEKYTTDDVQSFDRFYYSIKIS